MNTMEMRESINRNAERATAAVTDLCACQRTIENLYQVNSALINASGRLAERLEAVREQKAG